MQFLQSFIQNCKFSLCWIKFFFQQIDISKKCSILSRFCIVASKENARSSFSHSNCMFHENFLKKKKKVSHFFRRKNTQLCVYRERKITLKKKKISIKTCIFPRKWKLLAWMMNEERENDRSISISKKKKSRLLRDVYVWTL